MKANSTRIRILAAVVGVLFIALIVDSVLKSRVDGDGSSSPRSRYMDKAKIVTTKRDLVARADQWKLALDGIRASWAEIEPTLVRAQTTTLAEAGFRDEVLAVASAFDLPANRVADTRSEPITGAPGMHLLEVRLEIESNIVPDVLRLVDRLENMPDRLTGIAEVRLEGPGINQAKQGLGATVVVQSIGFVEAPATTGRATP